MRWLVDEGSPAATVRRGGLGNLHTPQLASLYEAFAPAEARRIARTLALHDTPTPGSWWNRVESELRVLQPQCLDRRRPDAATLTRAIAAWEAQRNAEQATIAWRFSVT